MSMLWIGGGEGRGDGAAADVVPAIAYLGHQVVTGDPVVPGPYVQVRLFGIFPVKSAC